MIYLTRGARQGGTIDVWDLPRPPVLVRGNWRHPSYPDSQKSHAIPVGFARLDDRLAAKIFGRLPQNGELRKWHPRPPMK